MQYVKHFYILLLILECSGPGTSEGKRALYHCNYCNKDITGRIRIKCGVCSDFDLCIECFSVGAEVHPHKSGHRYRVMVSSSSAFFFLFLIQIILYFEIEVTNLCHRCFY